MARWIPARYLLTINAAIDEMINGDRDDILVIEAPPRHGKSELCSKYLPACFLGNYPDKRVILASYEANYARSWGRKARNVLEEWGRDLYGVGISEQQSAAVDWEIQGREGGMITAGVGGPITGRGAHLLIVDDPIKNAEEALSETVRDNIWDWWQSTAITRLEPGGKAIVIATRWHQEDLSGRLIAASESGDGPKVRRMTFPAISDEGYALFPERYPIDKLEAIKLKTDLFWWLCLYMQHPSLHGRAEWPAEYFGDHIWAEAGDWPDAFDTGVIAIDPSKGKSSKSSDFSAIVFLGLNRGLLWVDASMAKRPAETIVEDGIEMWRRHPAVTVAIETNQFQELFLPIFDAHCTRHRIPPFPITPVENLVKKELRISRLGPQLANHKFRFRNNEGCRMLVKQLREFPLCNHDDGPDALEIAQRTLEHQFRHCEPQEEYATA